MQKEEFTDKLLVLDTPANKLKLLAKGERGMTVTLTIDEVGVKVAFCSMFIGLRMTWKLEGSTGLTLTAELDSFEIELFIECYDLEELV